ncbi:hypothetical protein J6590_005255 [Homalodisca vitripennis]|nr:hypothetical protein J6590_005255 [Homalodisca vitripennis]
MLQVREVREKTGLEIRKKSGNPVSSQGEVREFRRCIANSRERTGIYPTHPVAYDPPGTLLHLRLSPTPSIIARRSRLPLAYSSILSAFHLA